MLRSERAIIKRSLCYSDCSHNPRANDKERIREAVKGSVPMRSTVITKQRTGSIQEMEKFPQIWIEDQIPKPASLSRFTQQSKARSLFQALKERSGEEYSQEALASTSLSKSFKETFQLHNVRVT
ncbi:Hypothetical predicted protein [Octopus vulgaris]|uniref:Uncharacterized protein n=1 Tax=Octopus vulgaris TaxID=6645 RepID=A0AA36AG84_OCTVU|nr:Hypothetical predicted protein [Octopus vulgaris]